jgi:hypothetical protein
VSKFPSQAAPAYAVPTPVYPEDDPLLPRTSRANDIFSMTIAALILVVACFFIHLMVAQNVVAEQKPDKYNLSGAAHAAISRRSAPRVRSASFASKCPAPPDQSDGIVAPNDSMSVSELEATPQKFANLTTHYRGIVVDDSVQDALHQVSTMNSANPKGVASFAETGPWDHFVDHSTAVLVAGSLGDYFPIGKQTGGHYVIVSSATLPVHYRDYVDVYGEFDPETNTITSPRIKVLAHRASG